jgi:hypothetical protein
MHPIHVSLFADVARFPAHTLWLFPFGVKILEYALGFPPLEMILYINGGVLIDYMSILDFHTIVGLWIYFHYGLPVVLKSQKALIHGPH